MFLGNNREGIRQQQISDKNIVPSQSERALYVGYLIEYFRH